MARAKLPPFIKSISGRIGENIYRTTKGKTFIHELSPSTKPPTEKQLAFQAKFKEAVAFAKEVLADPERRKEYTKKAKAKKKRNAYAAAISEFLAKK